MTASSAVLSPNVGSSIPSAKEVVRHSSPVPSPSSGRISALDGLRGIAILMILTYHVLSVARIGSGVLSHAFAALRLTWSGVDLFFVLSGFLIGGILLDVRDSSNYYSTFYLRRVYRIIPLYVALSVVSVTVLAILRANPRTSELVLFTHRPAPWYAYLTFTQNICFAFLGGFGGLMSISWSLAVEEQFYLTAPFFIRNLTRSQLVWLLFSIVVSAPVVRTVLLFSDSRGAFADYVLMPCRADALCLGVLTAVFVRSERCLKWVQLNRHWVYVVMVVLAGGLPALTMWGDKTSPAMVTLGYTWLASLYAVVLLHVVTMPEGILSGFLRRPELVKLGTVSYCVYLFHPLLVEGSRRVLLRYMIPSDWSGVAAGCVGVGATLCIAAVSWKYFEKPFLHLGHRFRY
jgi:peptidoglycan/LPS O-acetylase OafA/YrhL